MVQRRLIVLTSDPPFPPDCGHKVDQLNRWGGFARRGWDLRLICWKSPRDPLLPPNTIEILGQTFSKIDVLNIDYDWLALSRRLFNMIRYPSHVASRVPDETTVTRIVEEAVQFCPAAVVLDNIYGAVLGEAIAHACKRPVIVRGHNVEFQYFLGQATATRDLKSKVAWHIARLGLADYEEGLLRRAAWTYDISYDDVGFWRSRGIDTISWSPTVYPDSERGTLFPPAEREFDVAYIGNLRLPNNLKGLGWFVREVLPIMRRRRPDTSYCFAGSNPSEEAMRLFSEAPEIKLVPNAPSADKVLSNGRVLVNPILSGSGVNVKSIDMLRYDAPIVTTPIGCQGFGPEQAQQFIVRNDADGFADAIIVSLENPAPPAGREAARKIFGREGLDDQIKMIESVARL